MSYIIDRSLAFDGLFRYSTDNGTDYIVKISETAPNSGFWTLDFKKLSGDPSALEVFKTLNTLFTVAMEYAAEKNINNAYLLIAGDTIDEIQKKTVAFTRWIEYDWDYNIIKNPLITIDGMKSSINIPTNIIHIKRKIIKNQVTQQQSQSLMKFCSNCGTENNNFQFCPNCGSNLKQI
jgi:hypothetical protein